MHTYEIGTVIKFSDGKLYGVTSKLRGDGKQYLCLSTIVDPIEIIFAEIKETGDIKVVVDAEEKKRVLSLIAEQNQA